MSTRVFVAGASGVLGRRVVPALRAAGYDVTANVRNEEARRAAEASGAATATVDLFDPAATNSVGEEHDAIVNVATSIPTGASASRKSGWAMNDRLRSEASIALAAAVARPGGRYVGESITFPYVDAGDAWIDETHARTYFWGNQSCVDAEAASQIVTDEGGVGVALRFAMFFADDSAHTQLIRTLARRGIFGPPGAPDGPMSWIHVDDAAAAVVAALDAPSGCYNIAEAAPATRREHSEALARSVGRKRLRAIPQPLVRLGGAGLESLARSQRISSERFTMATGWTADVSVTDAWAS